MRALAACVVVTSGCFTSWVTLQASDKAVVLDEGVHESAVPIAGPREELRVRMPLAVEHDAPPPSSTGGPGLGPGPAKPFALSCSVTQRGQDTVYHAAFRYGQRWKWTTAIMFVLEAGAAAIIYADDTSAAGNVVAAALLAVDALGTGVIGFAPRKEIYRTETRADDTLVREDCPPGVALAVGAASYPLDAAGHLGTLGDAAVDEWMRAPRAPLRVTLAGQQLELAIGRDEQCTWNQEHHLAAGGRAPVCAQYVPRADVAVTLSVPVGTLTRAE